jgi:peptidoglycan/LPS O-acetylase OafA/YrhL
MISALSVCFAGIVTLVVLRSGGAAWWLRALRNPALVGVGKISYGLYLLHLLAIDAASWAASSLATGLAARALHIALSFGLSLALALISWRVLERPLLSLKDRVTKTPRAEELAAVSGAV